MTRIHILAEGYDHEFRDRLRAEWASIQASASGGSASNITGPVTGNVVQARDIHGDITFS